VAAVRVGPLDAERLDEVRRFGDAGMARRAAFAGGCSPEEGLHEA